MCWEGQKVGCREKAVERSSGQDGEVGLSEGKGTRYEPSVEAKAKTKV